MSKVPKSAERTLGLFLHDFHFEREFLNDGGDRTLSSGIKVGDKDQQPPPKRYKSDDIVGQSSNTQGGKSSSKFFRIEEGQVEDKVGSVQVQPSATNDAPKGGKDTGKSDVLRDQLNKKGKYISSTAPPKCSTAKSASGSKFMADAQKSYRNEHADEGRNDKVHIPDSFDESDIDSETLSDKLRKIGAYEGGGQGCSKDGDINDQ